jgi:hypothetical protein
MASDAALAHWQMIESHVHTGVLGQLLLHRLHFGIQGLEAAREFTPAIDKVLLKLIG